jgi:class 3 adenylate cyclase/HAMP domain-containing protein
MDLSSDGEGTIRVANEFSGELVSFPQQGKASVISAAIRSQSDVAGSFVFFILAWLALAGLSAALLLLYWLIFRYKAPLVLKQLAIFVPLIAVMTVFVTILVFQVATVPLEDSIEQRLQHLAQLGASEMEAADMDLLGFEGRSLSEIKESPAYAKLIHVVDRLINENKDPWNSAVYDYLYVKEAGSWWVIGSFDYIELYPYEKPEFEQVLASGEPVFLRYDDIYGTWLSALAPVFGTDGQPAGILEATMSANVLDEAGKAFIVRCIQGCLVIIVGFLAAFAIFTSLLLRSIRSMKSGADRIAGGDYDVDIDVRSQDEIQDLGDAFNSMSREIRDYITHVTLLNEANSRFVPSGFLTHLGKQNITEVRLGDQAKAEMTILFTDIRSFTDLSESMGPTELFGFLNDYLRRMGPEIREHGGFIDKYIGDAIMALFPGEGDQALEAVHGMFARLEELNEERKRSALMPVDMGVGVHRGPLMIGIIGEEMRFDGTVISDAVNLASRLESLTKYYGARAIVSEAQWESLVAPARFPSRFLDAVRVKGKHEIVRMRELLIPGDPNSALKLACSSTWESAWDAYQAGRFREALKLYESILKDNPADGAAELFSSRCVQYLSTMVPNAWDGVTTFGQK